MLLRLAGPLQSWGDRSAFNRRETRPQPTKSGVVGLLAAAAGRPREADITDLTDLHLGVRVDQPGTLLRDYHTVSDYRGRPLPQAGVNAKGLQKPTSPAKETHVTQRFYLQDAVFVCALEGPLPLLEALAAAIRRPSFPLTLGRRSCPPTQPVVLGDLRDPGLEAALRNEPWQAGHHEREAFLRRTPADRTDRIDLPATLDDPVGDDTWQDVPLTFDPRGRQFTTRRIRHTWLATPTGLTPQTTARRAADIERSEGSHDPFALLGW
nr:type I-E CRISPR-associated protein Cas5/CasD [Kitasatospora acidiphila]